MHTAAALPFLSSVCALGLALVALSRKPRGIADVAMAVGLVLLAAEAACAAISTQAPTPESVHRWQMIRLVILSTSLAPWLAFSLCYARGNYRWFVSRWRWALAAAFAIPVIAIVGFRETVLGAARINPKSDHWITALGWSGVGFYVTVLLTSVLILMNLESTYRAAVGTMRWKIKFSVMGVGLFWLVRIYTGSQAVLYRGLDANLALINAGGVILGCALILVSIFRTGSAQVDVHPSPSFLQSSVTIILVGVYLMFVGVFARVVARAGGDAAFAVKALVVLMSLVTVAALLQSDRARLWLRRFVSRHLDRPLYDYRVAWGKFTANTVSQVEQSELCRSLVRLTADLFQALSVSIWVFDSRGQMLVLAASSSLTDAEAAERGPNKEETATLRSVLRSHSQPLDLRRGAEPWRQILRRCQPNQFPDYSGPLVCVPLVGRGELLGVLLISDRISNFSFTDQDFDMLTCVASHIAASILNAQMAQKLVESKELEAFQNMAAFFVHDLKNAASTLNLMLKNLPDHFHDPAFREDALRGVSKGVDHINRLIARLTAFRHEMRLQASLNDLNEIVETASAALSLNHGTIVTKDFAALPPIRFDREQVQKVITNLILNAVEASGTNARIRLATSKQPAWVVVTVSDNGSGMTEEFLRTGLFRPFQTTKKTGLGIGMFQSKMIVEAHGGRITVSSEPGKGATFQVFLPLPEKGGS